VIASLLIPALAMAFARAPSKECTSAPECVLVKNTYCGDLQSITLGQDAKWADWEKKLAEASRADKVVCKPGARMDPRMFEPFCDNGQCAVRAKERPGLTR
jgi:hypothetical protein